ncbi:unnamed protein product [Candida verbasci]|uniref:Uncharacterized protein n=1 Tax=Candida verbasci TaxID=1227364 RepID=A0A9W4X9U2_9ASCO|nr:unnamed protein product [Candida verbasci]
MTSPAVVIDNGSYTTKAGFATDDLPNLVFSSNYMIDKNGKVIIGDDEMLNNPNLEVMTLLDNGLVYNFDRIVDNWSYVYDNIDNNNGIDSKEYPLVITEQTWNTNKNKTKLCQIAFENFEVPIFSLIKNPLSQLYGCGKSTGLVIDIGASVTSVTPILDGIIQNKSSYHSKYAGDFLNLHILNYLQSKTDNLGVSGSDSFKQWNLSHGLLSDYKNLSLSYQVKNYQLLNHSHINVSDQRNHLEHLFDPISFKIPNISIPEPTLDKPESHGLTNLIYFSLTNLQQSLYATNSDSNGAPSQNRFARFIELFKTLLNNVLITGGTSSAQGLPDHIINDLRALTQKFFPDYPFSYAVHQIRPTNSDNSDIWDRQFGSWLGACNLANMLNDESGNKIALDNWFISKADYEELGEDLVLEKFK